jgi:hypothetical protein
MKVHRCIAIVAVVTTLSGGIGQAFGQFFRSAAPVATPARTAMAPTALSPADSTTLPPGPTPTLAPPMSGGMPMTAASLTPVAPGGPEVPLVMPPDAQPPMGTTVVETDGGMPCMPAERFWFRADYLSWWAKGVRLPALVTTSPTGTLVAEAGVLGQNTTVVYGDREVLADMRSGYRLSMGIWLDTCHNWDLEFDYVSPGDERYRFSQQSSGAPILARPFYNVQTGLQASILVAYPGATAGTILVEGRDHLQSAGATVAYRLFSCDCCGNGCLPWRRILSGDCAPALGCRTDLLGGFRYFGLSDRISIGTLSTIQSTDPTQRITFNIRDSFQAKNEFYGAEVGLRSSFERGRLSLGLLAKMAVGSNHRTVSISGETITAVPGRTPASTSGGIFALGTNSGTYQRDTFAVIPQLGVELGFQITQRLRAYGGYDLVYWSCVSRAPEQIDLNVDPRNIPPAQAGATRFPAFNDRVSCFWAQGLHAGLEYRY